jgi:hypothetical protein
MRPVQPPPDSLPVSPLPYLNFVVFAYVIESIRRTELHKLRIAGRLHSIALNAFSLRPFDSLPINAVTDQLQKSRVSAKAETCYIPRVAPQSPQASFADT